MVTLNFPLIVGGLNGFHIGGILFECRSLAAFTTRQQHVPLAGNQDACTSGTTRGWMQGIGAVGFSDNEAATDGTKLDLNIGGFPGFGGCDSPQSTTLDYPPKKTLGTNISHPQGSWEDEFPFQLVGICMDMLVSWRVSLSVHTFKSE